VGTDLEFPPQSSSFGQLARFSPLGSVRLLSQMGPSSLWRLSCWSWGQFLQWYVACWNWL